MPSSINHLFNLSFVIYKWAGDFNHTMSDCTWNYVLLGEKTFYGMSEKGATTEEILEYARLTKAKIKGTLGDYVGVKEY